MSKKKNDMKNIQNTNLHVTQKYNYSDCKKVLVSKFQHYDVEISVNVFCLILVINSL